MADTGIAAGTDWPAYLTEVWVLTSIAICIIIFRWLIRLRTVGITRFQGDDICVIGVLAFTIMDATTVTIAHRKGQNFDITEAQLPLLTDTDIARLTYGSKIETSAWYSYVTLIWCMKFTMLFFYRRLTLGSLHAKAVVWLFWFTGICYIANIGVLTFGCFPTHLNWQVKPLPPFRCLFRPQNFYSTAVLNISTDAALLAVPVPLLWKLNMPLQRKIVIGMTLTTGILVIVAAIIRVVLSLNAAPSASNTNKWGVRETFLAVIAINIPIYRPIFNSGFWTWGPYDPVPSAPRTKNFGTSEGKSRSKFDAWRTTDLEGARHTVAVTAQPATPIREEFEMKSGQIMRTAVTVQTSSMQSDEEILIQKP